MRSILLHIHNDPCLEARLQVALDLARAFDGHLTCLQVTPLDFLLPGDPYGTMAAEMLPVLRKNADELRESVSSRLAHEDVAWEWRQEEGLAYDFLMQASAISDVVVLGACDPISQGRGPSHLAGAVAIRAHAPVLLAPRTAARFDASGTAVVGWNGSIESAHALKAAMPLLAKARSVVLATVAETPDQTEGAIAAVEAAEYLSRHGIECEIVGFPLEQRSAARVLADAAAARKASYLVMGAYGHARFVETIWGGVTRELFSDPPLPLLACH